MELKNYWSPKDAAYRFPTLVVAMQYVDELTDDDWVYITNKEDSNLVAKIQKVFR